MVLADTPDALEASPMFMAASLIRMLRSLAFARSDQLRPRTQRQNKPTPTDPRSLLAAKPRGPVGDLGVLDAAKEQRQVRHRGTSRQFVEQQGSRPRRPEERTVRHPERIEDRSRSVRQKGCRYPGAEAGKVERGAQAAGGGRRIGADRRPGCRTLQILVPGRPDGPRLGRGAAKFHGLVVLGQLTQASVQLFG